MIHFLRRISLSLLLLVLWGQPALAQAGIQVQVNTATVKFPVGIDFRLVASSDLRITKVTLHYGIIGKACNVTEAQQDLAPTPSDSVDLDWQLEFKHVGVLPPGVQVWWQWEIHDDSGAQLLTQKQTNVVSDSTYAWHSLSRQSVTVTWSEGSQAFGAQLLDRAISSLDRLNRQLGVRPTGPVQVVVYPTAQAVRQALIYVPEWTGGIAYPEYDITVIGAAPGEDAWVNTVIPHELAHLVVGTLVFNCRGVQLPVWLNEGLAVVAQGPATPDDLARLSASLHGGALPALSSLAGGFQADAAQATLSYAQSGEVVRYLIGAYGAGSISTLLSSMQQGNPINAALQQVYGFDTDGLDAAWRTAEGAPVQATATPAATAAERTAVPTLALYTAVPPATATVPTATLLSSSTPQPAEPTATNSPLPLTTSTSFRSPAPTRAAQAAPTAVPWLLGGAGILVCGLVIVAGLVGLLLARRAKGKT